MNFIKKWFTALLMLLAPLSAFATLPAGVTDAITAAQTDGVTVAALVLGVIIAIAAFKYIRQAL